MPETASLKNGIETVGFQIVIPGGRFKKNRNLSARSRQPRRPGFGKQPHRGKIDPFEHHHARTPPPARSPPVHRRNPTPPHRPPSPTAGVRPAEPRRPADAVRRRATTRRSKPANRFPHRYSTRSPAAAPPAGAIPRYTGSNPGQRHHHTGAVKCAVTRSIVRCVTQQLWTSSTLRVGGTLPTSRSTGEP